MDKQIVALFIPIIALAIPVTAIIMSGLLKIRRLRLEEANLQIHGGPSGGSEEVQALRNDVELLQRQLSELNERVDFTERLLARGRVPDSSEQLRPPG